METGGAGDSQSWAERVEAGIDEEFQQDRPAKRCRSQSRRCEQRPTFPFPLQDSEGRLASVSQLYEHAGEQPAARHNVAGRGIMHLHLEMLPCNAMCLGNQVVCMIAEYHLTGSARGPSSLSPLLPEAATTLLPPIKEYVPGVAFEGTRDVRVLDRARTLQVAVWLHRLDMSAGGDGMASETLDASRHNQGPLLDLFLTAMMGNLTFQEVVNRVLYENQCQAQRSLDDLRARHARIREELDDLTKAHGEESDKSSRKRIKEIDMRRKDLESLRERISYHESHLGEDPSEDSTPGDAEAEMATTLGADDAPSESATTQASGTPQLRAKPMPWRWMTRVFAHLQLAPSPLRMIYSLVVESLGWRRTWPTLQSRLPRDPNGEGEEASG